MGTTQVIAKRFPAPFVLGKIKIQFAFAVVKSLLERIRDAFMVLRPIGEAVDDDLQRRLARRRLVEFFKIAQIFAVEQAMKAGALQARLNFLPR